MVDTNPGATARTGASRVDARRRLAVTPAAGSLIWSPLRNARRFRRREPRSAPSPWCFNAGANMGPKRVGLKRAKRTNGPSLLRQLPRRCPSLQRPPSQATVRRATRSSPRSPTARPPAQPLPRASRGSEPSHPVHLHSVRQAGRVTTMRGPGLSPPVDTEIVTAPSRWTAGRMKDECSRSSALLTHTPEDSAASVDGAVDR